MWVTRKCLVVGLCLSKVVDFRASATCKERIFSCATRGELTCSIVCSSNPEGDEVRSARKEMQLITEDAVGNAPLGIDEASSHQASSRRRRLVNVQEMNEQVADAMLNDESLPGYTQVASVEFTSNLSEPVIVPIVTEAVEDEASEKCERVCVDNRLRDCMVSEVCGGEKVWLSEFWTITHYCIAATDPVGGWGFRIPSSVGMVPAHITSVFFNSTLYPTTGPDDTFQSDTAQLTVAFSKDDAPRYADSVMHKCAIEDIVGEEVKADIIRGPRHAEMILSFSPADLFPSQLDWIFGDTILLSVTGDMAVIANGGVLPPSMYNTTLAIEHYLIV